MPVFFSTGTESVIRTPGWFGYLLLRCARCSTHYGRSYPFQPYSVFLLRKNDESAIRRQQQKQRRQQALLYSSGWLRSSGCVSTKLRAARARVGP